jgi:hypothetical protein
MIPGAIIFQDVHAYQGRVRSKIPLLANHDFIRYRKKAALLFYVQTF